MLKVLQSDMKGDELRKKVLLTEAIANVLAERPSGCARYPQQRGLCR